MRIAFAASIVMVGASILAAPSFAQVDYGRFDRYLPQDMTRFLVNPVPIPRIVLTPELIDEYIVVAPQMARFQEQGWYCDDPDSCARVWGPINAYLSQHGFTMGPWGYWSTGIAIAQAYEYVNPALTAPEKEALVAGWGYTPNATQIDAVTDRYDVLTAFYGD